MKEDTKSETVTIKFNKEDEADNTADASTVAAAINAVSTLVDSVHEGYKENAEYLVKARPFGRGSLEVPLDIIVLVGGLLIADYPFFEKIWSILSQYFELKKMVTGKSFSIREGNLVVIENSIIRVDSIAINMLDSSKGEGRYLAAMFEGAMDDARMRSIEVKSSNYSRERIIVEREEFRVMSEPVSVESIYPTQEKSSREIVTIRSVSFDPSLKWHFSWNGKLIAAAVLDTAFKARINERRETFANGDRLDVQLYRVQKYDTHDEEYLDRQFTIVSVYNHIQKQHETGELFE